MFDKDYNYWDEKRYFPICSKCNQPYNYNTRYCSKECWINQRKQKKPNIYDEFVNIFDNIIIEKKEDFIYKNECDILQIEPPIEETKIKKSYRKLALKYHPDKNGDVDMFIKIKSAYDVLINVC